MNFFLQKATQTILWLIAFSLIPYFSPNLKKWRVIQPREIRLAKNSQTTHESMATAKIKGIATTAPGEIEDSTGQAMTHFYEVLSQAEVEDKIVRISHYGDSPITGDMITSTIRRKLQLRFGDAGHGFILAGKPWGWYQHIGVKQEVSTEWLSYPMFISKGDHRFGLGGAGFSTREAGVATTLSTIDADRVGLNVSSFDVYYLQQSGGGEFALEVDGVHQSTVSTAANETHTGFTKIEVPQGQHSLTIKTVGNGEVRLFGVVLESGTRGVQYDSLGVNGAFVGLLSRYQDEATWAEQLKRRNPDLVILAYGANESEFENWPMDQYEKDTREVIRRIRTAVPEASILFVGPMDRGKRGPGGAIITRPTIPKLIDAQRRLAAENGCAFFDTFTAMGGEGTVARWTEAKPKLMGGDFTHPTWQGSEIVGTLIHDALIRAYEKNRPPQTLAQNSQSQTRISHLTKGK